MNENENRIEVERIIKEKFKKTTKESENKTETPRVKIIGFIKKPYTSNEVKQLIFKLMNMTIPELEIDSVEVEKTAKQGSITEKERFVS